MASSTCVKCGNHSFEMKENTPRTSNYKLLFVQCTSCGAVVGVMDYYNIGSKIQEVQDELDKIKRYLSAIGS